jgi:hypothetical protein
VDEKIVMLVGPRSENSKRKGNSNEIQICKDLINHFVTYFQESAEPGKKFD